MRRVLSGSILAGLLSLVAVTGCASSASLRAAEAGRFDELRRTVGRRASPRHAGRRRRTSDCPRDRAGEIARATPPSGADRLRELRTCARALEDALAERAAGSDAIATAAEMLLLEAGLTDPESVKRYASDAAAGRYPGKDAALRALETRALVTAEDGAVRRSRMLDGDQEVRVSALRAAAAAADPSDREALLEAARLDLTRSRGRWRSAPPGRSAIRRSCWRCAISGPSRMSPGARRSPKRGRRRARWAAAGARAALGDLRPARRADRRGARAGPRGRRGRRRSGLRPHRRHPLQPEPGSRLRHPLRAAPGRAGAISRSSRRKAIRMRPWSSPSIAVTSTPRRGTSRRASAPRRSLG